MLPCQYGIHVNIQWPFGRADYAEIGRMYSTSTSTDIATERVIRVLQSDTVRVATAKSRNRGVAPNPSQSILVPYRNLLRHCTVLYSIVLCSISDYGTSTRTSTRTSRGSVGTRVLGLRLSVTDTQIHTHTEEASLNRADVQIKRRKLHRIYHAKVTISGSRHQPTPKHNLQCRVLVHVRQTYEYPQ